VAKSPVGKGGGGSAEQREGEEEDEDDDEEEAKLALLGLRELVQAKPRDVVEYLLPKLLHTPVSIASANVLAAVADVCGSVLQYHFQLLVPIFVKELTSLDKEILSEAAASDGGGQDTSSSPSVLRKAALERCASSVMGAANTSGVNFLCQELGKQIEHESSVASRQWGCFLLDQFLRNSKADYREYLPVFLKYLLARVAETNVPLLHAVSSALAGLVGGGGADSGGGGGGGLDELCSHLEFVRSCITSTASDARHSIGGSALVSEEGELLLPLFALPKALEPLLAMYLHGLMNGSANMREVAADGIGELASLTAAPALKSYLVKTTGPLIRVIGDRFPSSLKTAILSTLCILLDKGGGGLRAFAPQLQTTFVKALSDSSRQARAKAVSAIGKLLSISTRVDPLLTELTQVLSAAESSAIKASVLEAISITLSQAGDKATPAMLEKIRHTVFAYLSEEDESLRGGGALCVGACAAFFEPAQITDLVFDLVERSSSSSGKGGGGGGGGAGNISLGNLAAVCAVMKNAGGRGEEVREEAFKLIHDALKTDGSSSGGGAGELYETQIKVVACTSLEIMFTFPTHAAAAARKAEYEDASFFAVAAFASSLARCAENSSR